MARYNKINLGPADKNCPQSRDRIASVAITPGSQVKLSASGQFELAGAADAEQGIQLYIANHNYFQGLQVDDANPVNDTMQGLLPLKDGIYACLVANGVNITAEDFALKVGPNGVLTSATVGTDRVQYRANEIYNNNTGSAQLVEVRPVTV